MRGLDQERSRPLEERRTGLVGSPLPRYEGAQGPRQVRGLAEPSELLLPAVETALTKFLRELAGGAGARPSLQGSPGGRWGTGLRPLP